jgi:hypothetical protein
VTRHYSCEHYQRGTQLCGRLGGPCDGERCGWDVPDTELERDIVAGCAEIANLLGLYMEVIGQRNAKGSGTTVGAPDAILYRNGHAIPVEFKRADGRVRWGQDVARQCRAAQGVQTHVIRTVQEFADLCGGRRRSA